jgi:hypothetical protein
MFGSHLIKHWSSTQTSVALSSGEAEFAGVIRGAGQGLGYQALLQDLGVKAHLRVWTDSSAAIGICTRQGLGKLRHLDTHTLWIQQAVRMGRVDLRKVLGEKNPADLLTKHGLSRERLEMLVKLHGCGYRDGRSGIAPLARTGQSDRITMANAGGNAGTLGNVDKVSPYPGRSTRVCHGGSGAPTDSVDYGSGSDSFNGSGSPAMPHLDFTGHDLDEAYPSIKAPVDEQLDDLADDARDTVFQHGLQIAEEIRSQMSQHGRRRYEATTTTPTGKTTTTTVATTDYNNGVSGVSMKLADTGVGEKKDEVKFKGKLGCYAATKSSSLRRRRSVRFRAMESGTTSQAGACAYRLDSEHSDVCAVSEVSIGANLNDAKHSEVLSLEQDLSICLAPQFCVDWIVSAPSRLFLRP